MILIAGGSGFLGQNTARCLAERGEESLLIQRHPMQPHPLLVPYWGKEVKEAVGDMLDLTFILGLLKTFSVDSIIHVAHTSSGVRHEYGYDPLLHQTVQVQVQGTLNCLEAARLMDLRRVTFISSVDLYRGWPKQCDEWQEEAFLPPISFSFIGGKKKAVEQLCFLYAHSCELSVVSIRLGHNYGPACDWHVLNTIIRNAMEGKPSDLPELPLNSRRHTVYSKDSGEGVATIHLAESLNHYIYNLSDGEHPTMAEFAQAVKESVPGAEITLGPPEEEKTEYRPVAMKRMKEELIEERGLRTIVVDVGVLGHVPFKPTISREQVAEAGGTTIQELMNNKEHEPKSVMDKMAKGATKLIRELYDTGELDGVLSGGGSMGTALALEVFKALPIGVPKLIVSTMAYSNAITPDMLSGADLMMLPLVAGLWGLNNMSIRSLKTAAGAIIGATEENDQIHISTKKTVGVTSVGSSVQGYMKDLKPRIEERGYEVAVFHGIGMSGRMFEKSITDGFIAASLDLAVSGELLNYIAGGACSAGKHRLEAAGKMGIPQIVCPSRLIFHWWSGSPLPEKYMNRVRFRHNTLIGPVACSREEAAEVAVLMATKLNNAKGPTAVGDAGRCLHGNFKESAPGYICACW